MINLATTSQFVTIPQAKAAIIAAWAPGQGGPADQQTRPYHNKLRFRFIFCIGETQPDRVVCQYVIDFKSRDRKQSYTEEDTVTYSRRGPQVRFDNAYGRLPI